MKLTFNDIKTNVKAFVAGFYVSTKTEKGKVIAHVLQGMVSRYLSFNNEKNDYPRLGAYLNVGNGVFFFRGGLRVAGNLATKNERRFLSALAKCDIPKPEISILDEGKVQLRDYQREAVIKALKHYFSLLSLPTGAGKTFIEAVLARELSRRGLTVYFVAPTKILLKQFEATYSKIYGQCDIKTITSAKLNKDFRTLLQANVALIFDEAHTSAQLLSKVPLKLLKDLHVYAFTATPFRRIYRDKVVKTKYKQDYTILSLFGFPVFEIGKEDLIRQGYLVNVKVRMKRVKIENKIENEAEYRRLRTKIAVNRDVVKAIAQTVLKERDKNVMVISDLAEQARLIAKVLAIAKDKREIYYVDSNGVERVQNVNGRVVFNRIASKKELQKWAKEVESKKGWVICATTVFQAGVDIRSTEVVVNAMGGATETAVLQRLGRVTRPYDGKKEGVFIDIAYDDGGGMLSALSNKKRGIYIRNGYTVLPF